MKRIVSLSLFAAVSTSTGALADEGMWTFNNFPSAKVKAKYGFEPNKEWLDHVRLSSVRIAGGCSASVISEDGLVMTNHHCARECIENLSGNAKKDFNKDGFLAKAQGDEARCPGMELNQLSEITDVTKRVQDATKSVGDDKFADTQKSVIAGIEKECATSDEFRCEVVTLYRGGRYDLYKYRRFQDIRLVFAPEDAIAFFGGDPDNFNFPRYDLDVSMVRIYGTDGKPMKMAHHLAWSDGTVKEGDVTFVPGNPGGTSRGLTVAQLDDDRDVRLPTVLMRLAELRGYISQYQERGNEQKRHSNDLLFGAENAFKAYKGRQASLADKNFYGQLVKNEQDFRAKVKAKPELEKQYGQVWETIGGLVKKQQALRTEFKALENGPKSELFAIARGYVRYAEESGKPNGERLKEFTDSRLPQFKQEMLANRPIYDELEISTLTWSLTKMREDLGPDHALIKRVFGNKSPAEIAKAAVKGSKLKDLKTDKTGNAVGGLRKELLDGGRAKIDANKDPMIELARSFDADARAVRKKWETEIEGPLKKQQELLARARFNVYGDTLYPDATFTPRLSYGAIKGWEENGKQVKPFTTLGGAFERHTGAEPFALPKSWLSAKAKLGESVPFNFVANNDIIGGNSGSPMVNQKGEIIGLVFDGNIHSLGGEYGFDESLNRTVAVHSAALLETMEKIYGAQRLVEEIKGTAAGTRSGQP